MLSRGSTQNTFNHSNSTSTSEGHNLGEVEYVWLVLGGDALLSFDVLDDCLLNLSLVKNNISSSSIWYK